MALFAVTAVGVCVFAVGLDNFRPRINLQRLRRPEPPGVYSLRTSRSRRSGRGGHRSAERPSPARARPAERRLTPRGARAHALPKSQHVTGQVLNSQHAKTDRISSGPSRRRNTSVVGTTDQPHNIDHARACSIDAHLRCETCNTGAHTSRARRPSRAPRSPQTARSSGTSRKCADTATPRGAVTPPHRDAASRHVKDAPKMVPMPLPTCSAATEAPAAYPPRTPRGCAALSCQRRAESRSSASSDSSIVATAKS